MIGEFNKGFITQYQFTDQGRYSISAYFSFFQSQIFTGDAHLTIYPPLEEILWESFFPLLEAKELFGNGIGTAAHLGILKALKYEISEVDDYLVIHRKVSDSRAAQLKKIGFDVIDGTLEPIRFSEYFAISENYAKSKGLK